LTELAKDICLYRKRVVFITGAGISVASGVRPFRGSSGVWTQHIWTTATREAFRKDPLEWYNDFWLPCLTLPQNAKPNASHHALTELLNTYPNLKMITQNVDGLQESSSPHQIIEAHGRLGLYKCLPEEDSDTDSDSDDDDERLVHLGHRRKRRLATKKVTCPYQQHESLTIDQVEPAAIRPTLASSLPERRLTEAPKCPSCRNFLAPQALLFDEGYHSHDFYQFQTMEEWLAKAEVIVFCGTSFAVRLPEITLEHARARGIPVYNFNTQDFLESTVRLNATNVTGPSEESLPRLWQACQDLQAPLPLPISPPSRDTVATATTTALSPGGIKVKS
jgi:NAD-dependent SIR2 family protein deacetylase